MHVHFSHSVCNVGIESTVVGIDCQQHQMILFRRGGITENSLRDCLRTGGFDMGITEPVKHVPMAMKEAQVAPGQLITHYAPYCDTYLVASFLPLNIRSNSRKVPLFPHSYKIALRARC